MAGEAEARPTPGPWEAHGVSIHGPDGMIGETGFGLRDDPEMVANARLIAAAPDLLAACLEILEHPGDCLVPGTTHDQLAAAVARAKGVPPA